MNGCCPEKEAGRFHRVRLYCLSSANQRIVAMKTNQLIFTVLGSLCLASHAPSSQIEQQDINEIKPGITTETDLARRFSPTDVVVGDAGSKPWLHRPKPCAPP